MAKFQVNSDPPRWLNRLLLWFCDDDIVEEIEGDLHEEYRHISRQQGLRQARKQYLISVFKFLKPRFMQKLSNTQDYVPRLGNYLKVSLRNFQRHKLIGSVNLMGFITGLTVMMLVGEYLADQLSADRFIPEHEKVYRVVWNYRSQTYSNLGFENYNGGNRSDQLLMVNALRDIPEVDKVAQLVISNTAVMGREFFVEGNGRSLPEDKVLFTNTPEALQDIFQWPLLSGSFDGVLSGKVVLTESSAEKLFGEGWASQAIGSELRLGEAVYLVQAVMKDVPDHSHMSFNMMALVDSIPGSWGAYTYLKLKENYPLSDMNLKVTEARHRIRPQAINDPLEKGLELQRVTDIHLGSDYLYELETNVNVTNLYLFGIIGLVVLAITMTNYLNLSIAMYTSRLKEIGVRKVIGARKRDIRSQFLFESIFNTVFALPFALALVFVLLPAFNELLMVRLSFNSIFSVGHIAVFLLVTLLTGVLCGLYPSSLLAAKPLLALLGKAADQGRSGLGLRKVLVGGQFLLLMVLSGFAFYVNSQLQYIQNKELGFDKTGVVAFSFSGAESFALLKQELLKNPNVLAVGNGSLPGNNPFNTVTYKFEGVEEVFDDANQIYMDVGAARVLGLSSDAFNLLENGRNSVVVINETAAKKYEQVSGLERQALVGKKIIESPTDLREDGTMGYPSTVDGFISDFHFFSLREEYNPLFITVYNEMNWVYSVQVKVNTQAFSETVAFIEQAYYEQEKETPFNPVFMEERLEKLYANENRVGKLVSLLSYLAVFLAMAGLVGLTHYMARMKQREVAIRKVLGAGVGSILRLMSREFVVIAVLALVVALPLTLLLVNRWLENFAFHVSPSLITLVTLGIVGTSLMLSAVLAQSYRTANHNPVRTLNQE